MLWWSHIVKSLITSMQTFVLIAKLMLKLKSIYWKQMKLKQNQSVVIFLQFSYDWQPCATNSQVYWGCPDPVHQVISLISAPWVSEELINKINRHSVLLDWKHALSVFHCTRLQWNLCVCINLSTLENTSIKENVIKLKTWLQTFFEILCPRSAVALSSRWRLINSASMSHLISWAILLVKT